MFSKKMKCIYIKPTTCKQKESSTNIKRVNDLARRRNASTLNPRHANEKRVPQISKGEHGRHQNRTFSENWLLWNINNSEFPPI